MGFAQANWNEPLIFERSAQGKIGYHSSSEDQSHLRDLVPEKVLRAEPPKLPEVSEVEVVRHYTRLSQHNYGVDLGLYPLGSCTMKYNPKLCDVVVGNHKVQDLHPDQDESLVQGTLRILYELSQILAEIVGMHEVSLQPAAGAHGEFTGALIMRAYHKDAGRLKERDEIIIPDSAHGTNPASAAMAGFKVVKIPSNEKGQVDIESLKSAAGERTAGFMITNPNTLGLFETNILEISEIVHRAGGLLYYDGANLNAILGKTRPREMGFDIVHINIHKTFATPHGGGGPGAGPIAVTEELAKFLPVPLVEYDGNRYYLDFDRPHSIGKIRAFYGNVAVLVRAYAYILMLGAKGLQEVAELSVLNANYLARRIAAIPGFELTYSPDQPRKHECVLSASRLARETGVTALNVSKRLLDFGIHAPTVYFPLIVNEAIMAEPTETVSKEELDQMIRAFATISGEAYRDPGRVLEAPTGTTVRRIDEAKASHPRTMTLRWKASGRV